MTEPTSPPSAAADRPEACPLCGGPNGCGLAAGGTTCWCFDAEISPEVLERVPADARDRRCICAACAGQAAGAAPSSVER